MRPVVDSHVHVGEGDGLTGPWDTHASLRTYLDWARPAGITGAVLMAPLTTDYDRANQAVAAIARRDPARFMAYLFVDTGKGTRDLAARVDRAVRTHGFCGIKVHAHDGRVTRDVAEGARRAGVPVLYDPRGDTASVEMAARAYPDVAWIIPHLSSFADEWKAQCAFVDQLCRLPNVFTDTAGVRYFELLQDAARRAGAQKILFGSDGPLLHPAVELAKVRALGLDPSDEALVLGGNVLALTASARRRRRRSRSWQAG